MYFAVVHSSLSVVNCFRSCTIFPCLQKRPAAPDGRPYSGPLALRPSIPAYPAHTYLPRYRTAARAATPRPGGPGKVPDYLCCVCRPRASRYCVEVIHDVMVQWPRGWCIGIGYIMFAHVTDVNFAREGVKDIIRYS